MENMKEIKAHMKSVQDIQKITNAMYLIASAKMRRAKESLERTRPYFSASQAEIKRVFRTADEVNSRYFYPENFGIPLNGTYACLVITADKFLRLLRKWLPSIPTPSFLLLANVEENIFQCTKFR